MVKAKKRIAPVKKKRVLSKKKKWALISVYNKAGIVEFAKKLIKLGWSIVSSGGTAGVLKNAGLKVTDVAKITGLKPILKHRVATLHPKVHAALIANLMDPEQVEEMKELGWDIFDLLCVDFYPLSEEIATPFSTMNMVVEKTDIGGPTMVASAAKGLRIVICRAEDREPVLTELEQSGNVSAATRQTLRARAEFEVSKYRGISAEYHGAGQFRIIAGERVPQSIKYGENAGQKPAVLYRTDSANKDPLALENFKMVEGTDPSYVNVTDLDRLLQTLTHIAQVQKVNWDIKPFMAVAVKHGNPCGAAVGSKPIEVLEKTVLGDPLAIHGGFVMVDFPIMGDEANMLLRAGLNPDDKNRIYDGIIAPEFSSEAIDALARKRTQKCRLMVNPALLAGDLPLDTAARFRYVRGGFLRQPNYTYVLDFNDPELHVFGACNDKKLKKDIALAWAIGSTSNSNTITIVRDGGLLGNGVGQQSRVAAAKLAVERAITAGHENQLLGSVAYSDSFFPFEDAVLALIEAGVRAIFSTSGALADKAIIKLCVDRGVTLIQLPDSKARGFFGH